MIAKFVLSISVAWQVQVSINITGKYKYNCCDVRPKVNNVRPAATCITSHEILNRADSVLAIICEYPTDLIVYSS